ncbi:hypothetical protein D3C84_1182090 [compost metagenome]
MFNSVFRGRSGRDRGRVQFDAPILEQLLCQLPGAEQDVIEPGKTGCFGTEVAISGALQLLAGFQAGGDFGGFET